MCAAVGDQCPESHLFLPAIDRRDRVPPVAAHLPTKQPRQSAHPDTPRTRPAAAGILYLWFPDALLRVSALRALHATGREMELSVSCARLGLSEGDLDTCVLELGGELTEAERRRTRALFIAGEQLPSLDDFSRIATLHELHVLAQTGWLLEQLENGRITSHFHPIVHAGDTSRVFAHEALLRGTGRNGEPLEPLSILQL